MNGRQHRKHTQGRCCGEKTLGCFIQIPYFPFCCFYQQFSVFLLVGEFIKDVMLVALGKGSTTTHACVTNEGGKGKTQQG